MNELSGLPARPRTDCTRAQGSIDLARRVDRPGCITPLRRFANGRIFAQSPAPQEVVEKRPTPEIDVSGIPHFSKKFPRKSSRDFSPQLLMPLQVAMKPPRASLHAPHFLAASNAGHYNCRNSLPEGNLLVIAEKTAKILHPRVLPKNRNSATFQWATPIDNAVKDFFDLKKREHLLLLSRKHERAKARKK